VTDLEAVAAGAVESAVLGPDDVLVLAFEGGMSREQFAALTENVTGGHPGLKGRVLLISGAKVLVARGAAKAVGE
jgi:hypothetical protein